MKLSTIAPVFLAFLAISLPACRTHDEAPESGHHKIVVTSPKLENVPLTQQYVCQIHSRRRTKVKALEMGYLQAITIKEGQTVKENELLFKVIPILYQAKLDAELAEVQYAKVERDNTLRLLKDKVVSQNELSLFEAKLARAEAKAALAKAELNFTEVRAPYAGVVDRLHEMQGSLVKEGDVLTSLSDNSEMWVYFNVPEKIYLEYKNTPVEEKDKQRIELMLADLSKFSHNGEPVNGRIAAIETIFNNETGTVPFRADFPNPNGLLRHGMTGNVLIRKMEKDALVIPQRATFEILDRRYVFVVGSEDNVVHQREIKVQHELPDEFILSKKVANEKTGAVIGLSVDDRFVYEGIQHIHDGDKVEYEFRKPEDILGNQRLHAE